MTDYLCWVEADGETEAGAKRFAALDAEAAAEHCAERSFEGGDPFEKIRIHTRSPLGELRIFDVVVDWSPDFICREVEPAAVGVAGDRCEAGNNCGRVGRPECQS